MPRSLSEQILLVQSVVMGVTPEQAKAIAQFCLNAEAKGENFAVWHHSAMYFGNADRCNCFTCAEKRKKKAEAASVSVWDDWTVC
jgi:hypothetical protein